MFAYYSQEADCAKKEKNKWDVSFAPGKLF